MKIAFPTKNSMIDDHFGHCQYYTIFEIENGLVKSSEKLPSPNGCGCKSDIAQKLQKMGVSLMIAGNMGDGAKNKLNGCDIEVIRGCHGNIEDVLQQYIKGEIKDSGFACASHNEHHECHHADK